MAPGPIERGAKRKSRNREQGVPVKCYHCGYVWRYTGKRMYTTCPNCYRRVKIAVARITEEEYRLLTGEL
jgi:hypothetical protein